MLASYSSEIFSFFRYFLLLNLFLENFFNLCFVDTSLINLFFLKLNSDNNILLMLLMVWFAYSYKSTHIIPFPVFIFLDILLVNSYFNSFDFSLFFSKLNPNLMNGLLLIHPVFLYLIFSFFVLLLLLPQKKKIHSILFYSTACTLYKSNYLYFILILLISIFLGS